MRKLALALLIVGTALAVHAATYTSIVFNWQAPASNGVTIAGYNLYEVQGSCPATLSTTGLAPVNGAALIGGTNYTIPYAALNACFFVTAVSNMGVESSPSAGFQANSNAPGSPSGITVTLK